MCGFVNSTKRYPSRSMGASQLPFVVVRGNASIPTTLMMTRTMSTTRVGMKRGKTKRMIKCSSNYKAPNKVTSSEVAVTETLFVLFFFGSKAILKQFHTHTHTNTYLYVIITYCCFSFIARRSHSDRSHGLRHVHAMSTALGVDTMSVRAALFSRFAVDSVVAARKHAKPSVSVGAGLDTTSPMGFGARA